MPLEPNKLSLRNGTTRVEAEKGSIAGTFVHGASTSLKAYDSVNATLLPYWAFWPPSRIEHNFITTESRYGDTVVEIVEPKVDAFYGVNPLFFAISRHTVEPSPKQRMNVTYPGEWGGTALAHSCCGGVIGVSGDDFEEVEKNETTVKVKRSPGGSVLWFEADLGNAELYLKPCTSIECAYH